MTANMALHLYNIWLQEAATASADDEIRADIQQAGFVGGSGTTAERISAETIDLTVSGQWRLGDVLSRKHALEAESLAASGFEAVPLFDDDRQDRNRGYYHVERVQANPAHQTTEADYQYTVALSEAGTHETAWRAVKTNDESVSTNLATGSSGLIAIDARARKVRWYDPASGTEAATIQATLAGDGGPVDHYDPAEPTFDDPTLIYELDFDRERETDVVVYDDRGGSKTITFESGTATGGFQYDNAQYDNVQYAGFGNAAEATRWQHVFHTSHEYEGRPVVDTGRLRVRFDETAGEVTAWQAPDGTYTETAIDHTDYDLFDADVEEIGPADARVFTEWEATDGSIDSAVLSFQRGFQECVVRVPDNESSVASDLESLLSPIASGQTADRNPSTALVRRAEVR